MAEVALLIGLAVCGAVCGACANAVAYALAWNRRAISPWMRTEPQIPRRGWLDCLPVLGWVRLAREVKFWGPRFWLRPLAAELLMAFLFPCLYLTEVSGYREWLPPNLASAATAPHANSAAQVNVEPNLSDLALAGDCGRARWQRYALHLLLLTFMLAATQTDLQEKLIPDAITIPGTLVGIVWVTLAPGSLLLDLPASRLFGLDEFGLGTTGNVWGSTPYSPFNWPHLAKLNSLILALTCYIGWCLALLNRRVLYRRGILVAMRSLLRGIRRSPATWRVVLPLLVLGSIGIVLVFRWTAFAWLGLTSSLMGLAIAGAMVWATRWVGGAALNMEALGFGDVTLMAMIGASLGWQACVLIFFLAPLTAVVVALLNFTLHGNHEIPYGPFLCLAAVILLFQWPSAWGASRFYFELGSLLAVLFAGLLILMGGMLVGLRLLRRKA